MKTLRVLLLAIAMIMASGAMAQTVYNSSGSSCGKIESNGTIRNSSGSSVGRFDSDGTIRNSSGSSIGKIDRDGTQQLWFLFRQSRRHPPRMGRRLFLLLPVLLNTKPQFRLHTRIRGRNRFHCSNPLSKGRA